MSTLLHRLTWTLPSLGVAAAIAVAPLQGQVEFQGYTNGCFTPGAPGCPAPDEPGLQIDFMSPGLHYINSQFDVTTGPVSNTAFFGGIAQLGTGQFFNNLGGILLESQDAFYEGFFSLAVRFTIPTVTSQFFEGTLLGEIFNGTGGAGIAWINGTNVQTFSYQLNGVTEEATLTVNDVDLNQVGVFNPISGNIVSVVPEPMTVVLLATGLLALGLVGYRRRETGAEDCAA